MGSWSIRQSAEVIEWTKSEENENVKKAFLDPFSDWWGKVFFYYISNYVVLHNILLINEERAPLTGLQSRKGSIISKWLLELGHLLPLVCLQPQLQDVLQHHWRHPPRPPEDPVLGAGPDWVPEPAVTGWEAEGGLLSPLSPLSDAAGGPLAQDIQTGLQLALASLEISDMVTRLTQSLTWLQVWI